MVRDSSGGLYVILVRRKEEAPPGSADHDNGALYYSADAAEHWRRVALPEAANAPNGLATPKNPDRLYLAAWGRFTPAGRMDKQLGTIPFYAEKNVILSGVAASRSEAAT